MRARAMLLGLAAAGLVEAACVQHFDGNWQSSGLWRKTVTVSGALVTGTSALASFPLLISVTDPELRDAAHGGGVRAGGFWLGTQQSLEVEMYDGTSGSLVAWIVVPTITSSGGASFDLLYGETIPAPVPSEGVWGGFAAVWHMAGDPSIGVADSTIAHDTGTCAGGMSAANVVPCQIGNCLSFDGVDDTVAIAENGTNLNFSTESFSVSMWVHSDVNLGPYDVVWHKGGSNVTIGGYDFELGSALWDTCISDGTKDTCAGFGDQSLAGSWHYLVENVDRTRGVLEAYTDGVLVDSNDISSFGSTHTSAPAVIDNLGDPFQGRVDELRVMRSARTPAWVAAEYRNQSAPGTYVTLGPAIAR